jgi:hypothetical protein
VRYKAFLIILLTVLSFQEVFAQFRAQLGVNAGYIVYPITGGGYNFEGGENFINPDTPHMEYGLSGGFNFLIPINRKVFLITHTNLAFYTSHVHYPSPFSDAHYDAPLRLLNLRQSISINKTYLLELPDFKIRTKLFGGVAFNSQNLASSISGSGAEYRYYTDLRVVGAIYPELFVGAGLIQKIADFGDFHFDISFNVLPYKQMVSHVEFQIINNVSASADIDTGHQYIFLNIIYFPKIKFFKKRRSWSICR